MKSGRIDLRLDESVYEWLKLKALEIAIETKDLKNGSLTAIVSTAIEEYIQKDNRMKLRADKEEKRKVEALERQSNHEALNALQKLSKLDEKLGVGVGARKERAKLAKAVIKPDPKKEKRDKKNKKLVESLDG